MIKKTVNQILHCHDLRKPCNVCTGYDRATSWGNKENNASKSGFVNVHKIMLHQLELAFSQGLRGAFIDPTVLIFYVTVC